MIELIQIWLVLCLAGDIFLFVVFEPPDPDGREVIT